MNSTTDILKKMEKNAKLYDKPIYKIGLCEGIHPLPVNEYVFGSIIEDPTEYVGLEEVAEEFFRNLIPNCLLELYVTGLPVVLMAAINAASKYINMLMAAINAASKYINIRNIVLMHYDSKTNTYYPQFLNNLDNKDN